MRSVLMLSWQACWQLGRPGHRPVVVRLFTPGVGLFESASIVDGNEGSVSGTAQFPIGAGQTISYSLACEKSFSPSNAFVAGTAITAIFTPAP